MELTEHERDYWRNAVEGIHTGTVEDAKIYLRENRKNYSPTNKAIFIQIIAEAVGEPFDDDVRKLIGDLIDKETIALNFVDGHYDRLRHSVLQELHANAMLQKHGNKYQLNLLDRFVNPPPSLWKQFRNRFFSRPSQLRPGHRTWDYG